MTSLAVPTPQMNTPQMPQMSTAQTHTAMQAVNTGTGALDTANSMFNSGMGEFNKVKGELTQDANVMKGNLGGKLSGWREKMKAKAEETKANIAQRQAEFEQYKATNAQDIVNGTRYQTGINNIKAQKDKQAANLKHFNDVIVPQNKKIFAESYAAKKAEQHAKSSSSGDLANTNEGMESKGLGMSTGMASTKPGSGAMTVGGRRRRRRRKSRKKRRKSKRKSRKRRKSRKKKRKRKSRKRRGGACANGKAKVYDESQEDFVCPENVTPTDDKYKKKMEGGRKSRKKRRRRRKRSSKKSRRRRRR